MTLETHIQELAKELGIEGGLPEEAEGIYILPLENDLSLSITDMQPGVYFFATLGSLPGNRKEEFLEYIMGANLFGQLTDGAVLGLDPHGSKLTLSFAVGKNMDYREFKEGLETFINSVDFWRDERLEYQEPQKGAFL